MVVTLNMQYLKMYNRKKKNKNTKSKVRLKIFLKL